MVVAGIDPGNEGALAFLNTDEAVMYFVDMPTFEFETTKRRIKPDPFGISRALSANELYHAYIEDVYSSPQMGVTSSFGFGESKGTLIGALAALQIPFTAVKPTDWKKHMRVKADKREAVNRASQLFPSLAHLFKGPKGGRIDGRAEAGMIALYAALELGLTPPKAITEWT